MVKQTDMRLDEFFMKVYRKLKLYGRSQRTVDLYQYSIHLFQATLCRAPTLADLNDNQLAKHMRKLEELKYSPFTIAKERSQLLAISNFARMKGYTKQAAYVATPKLPRKPPTAWRREELDRLIAACRETPGMVGNVKASDWWYLLHLLLWDTGERIGTLLHLRWAWIDRPWLELPAEFRKNGQQSLIFELSEETLQALDVVRSQQLPNCERALFWPMSLTLIYKHYNKILTRAGLPTDAKSKFHRMRRSVASHLKAAGGDATAALGHADPRVTYRSYYDPRITRQDEQPKDRLFRIGKPIDETDIEADIEADNSSQQSAKEQA